MKQIEKALNNLGLNKKETKLFLNLVSLGQATISQLSRKVVLPRTTLYPLLEKLLDKELIYKIKVGNHFEWEAVRPKELYKKINENMKVLRDNLLELEKDYGRILDDKQTSQVLFYTSHEGLLKTYGEILKLKKYERVYTIEGSRSVEQKIKRFQSKTIIEWQELFKKRNIIIESLIGEKALRMFKEISKEKMQVHLGRMTIVNILPDEFVDFNIDIICFKNTLSIIIVEKDISIIIKNNDIAEAFKKIFLAIRENSKKIDFNEYIKNSLS